MNIIILKILLSIISGICLGLYLKDVALFFYIAIIIIYIILANNTNLKKYFDLKFDIFILIFSIIIFALVCFVDNKYENLYAEISECYGVGEIISFAEEKTYTNKYIIKIKSIRKFKQI